VSSDDKAKSIFASRGTLKQLYGLFFMLSSTILTIFIHSVTFYDKAVAKEPAFGFEDKSAKSSSDKDDDVRVPEAEMAAIESMDGPLDNASGRKNPPVKQVRPAAKRRFDLVAEVVEQQNRAKRPRVEPIGNASVAAD
jgi:hypothetical protein